MNLMLPRFLAGAALLAVLPWAWSAELETLVADRAAIERVYHNHRLGTRPPFEEVLPRDLLETLVRLDQHKEALLQRVYGVEVTPALLAAEVQRINATTRAPEVLAELKAALGHDPARFARTVARPIVVERTLRARFDNDDALHAPQRRETEKIRARLIQATAEFRSRRSDEAQTSSSQPSTLNPQPDRSSLLTPAATNAWVEKLGLLLKQGHSNTVTETTWQLGARQAERLPAETLDDADVKKRFGQDAQLLSRPGREGEQNKFYFEDLSEELQRVLRAQLRQPGDVSAVIETPGGFLLYLAREKTATELSVLALAIPKRDYEQWLEEQSKGRP